MYLLYLSIAKTITEVFPKKNPDLKMTVYFWGALCFELPGGFCLTLVICTYSWIEVDAQSVQHSECCCTQQDIAQA